MTKISVVMCVHNGDKFIYESVNSILQQTCKNFELLILDDASTDKTLKILKSLKKKNSKIRIYKNKKKLGLTKSLIKLISKSNGQYIARLDADDICKKKRLEIQRRWLSKSRKNALIGTSGFKINEKSKIIGKFNLENLNHNKLKKKLLFKNYFLHSSTMFKKNYYKKVGGYNSKYFFSQDYDLWCKLSNIGRIKNISENLVFLRQHKKSISIKNRKKQSLNAFIISCLNQDKNIYLKTSKYDQIINQLSKITNIKKHFNAMCYLYSEFLPKKFSKNLFDLNFDEIKYLLQDKDFVLRKTAKKFII